MPIEEVIEEEIRHWINHFKLSVTEEQIIDLRDGLLNGAFYHAESDED